MCVKRVCVFVVFGGSVFIVNVLLFASMGICVLHAERLKINWRAGNEKFI